MPQQLSITQLLVCCHCPCIVCLCNCRLLDCWFQNKFLKIAAVNCCNLLSCRKTTASPVTNAATFALTNMPLRCWLIVAFSWLCCCGRHCHSLWLLSRFCFYCHCCRLHCCFWIFLLLPICCSTCCHCFPGSNSCWPAMPYCHPCLGIGCHVTIAASWLFLKYFIFCYVVNTLCYCL